MRVIATVAMSAAIGLASTGAVAAQCAGATHPESMTQHQAALSPVLQGKPVVARIHADWCPACKATQSTIDAVKAKYGNTIAFVQFDVTDGRTSAAAAADAKRLGLNNFFEANKTKTSTVAVLNPKTGAIVATFYDDTNATDYENAIDRTASEMRKT